ncbi:MAG TPA: hypothetical protein VF331_18405 [Polyangiales bacterium]
MTERTSASLRVRPGRALSGSVRVPLDAEVAQRALVLAALADGPGALLWPDAPLDSHLGSLLTALRALGVPIETDAEALRITGVGTDGLRMPSAALDAGRSYTALALLAGLIGAQRFGTRLLVHESLALRSVERIVGPLRARGAQIAGRSSHAGAPATPPLAIAPLVDGEQLSALDCELPAADAAAKGAVLVSALFAAGSTLLSEPTVSPDHLERAMVMLGLPLRRVGSVVCFEPRDWDHHIPAQPALALPGCTTCAAYLSAACLVVPGSRIALGGVGINPARTGYFDALRLWGADVQVLPRGDAGREPIADLIVRHRPLRGGVLDGEVLLRGRDEVPALAVLGSFAQRGAQLYDVDPLLADHDPHASALLGVLRATGIDATQKAGALCVTKLRHPTTGAVLASDDPQLVMAAVVAGLAGEGESVVEQGVAALLQAHPGFLEALQALGADIFLQGTPDK